MEELRGGEEESGASRHIAAFLGYFSRSWPLVTVYRARARACASFPPFVPLREKRRRFFFSESVELSQDYPE